MELLPNSKITTYIKDASMCINFLSTILCLVRNKAQGKFTFQVLLQSKERLSGLSWPSVRLSAAVIGQALLQFQI
jgi:hypothetical protein